MPRALFAVYVDDLIQELRDLDLGCHVAGLFCGVVGFCNDILLLASTRDSIREGELKDGSMDITAKIMTIYSILVNLCVSDDKANIQGEQ